jgi:hypothetical protein
MAGYRDQNVSISPDQISMNGNVFAPSTVRKVGVYDDLAVFRTVGRMARGAVFLFMGFLSVLLAVQADDSPIWIRMAILLSVAAVPLLWFLQHRGRAMRVESHPSKLSNTLLTLRVDLHGGEQMTIQSKDEAYLRQIERELKKVVHR